MERYIQYFAGALVLLLVAGAIVLMSQRAGIDFLKKKAGLVSRLLASVEPAAGLEGNLTRLLEVICTVVAAPSYAAYIRGEKGDSLVLKAVVQQNEAFLNLNLSYGRLMPYKKEVFFLPASLPIGEMPDGVRVKKHGEVPLLFIPLCDSLIAVGPVKSVSKRQRELLKAAAAAFEPVFELLLEAQRLSEQAAVVTTTHRAVQNISGVFTDFGVMADLVMAVSLKSTGAAGGMLITFDGGVGSVERVIGSDGEVERLARADASLPAVFDAVLGDGDFRVVKKQDREFFFIPPYFAAADAEVFYLVRVPSDKLRSLMAFYALSDPELKDYQKKVLEVMARRLVDIIDGHARFKEFSTSRVELLKELARLTDSLRPNSVGYSELMYRYSYITAKALGLAENDCREIALAGELSNIGVIGISEDILFKSGRYTEGEFEKMKHHSEAGAAIIEAAICNARVASYIRHHHERMDGFGYPDGLLGDAIPLGSRIILTVQSFLAKVISRDYRPALPFEEAVKQLKAAAGTQLDPAAVEALTGWFEQKERGLKAGESDGPLGPCWEMRCAPEDVCVNCPAYKNPCARCWEIEGVNCSAHGDECGRCFIHTEYVWRTRENGKVAAIRADGKGELRRG